MSDIGRLTSREDWERYWRTFQPHLVEGTFFDDLLEAFPSAGKFVEIGGFPGHYASYFKRIKDYDVSILDYRIIPEVVSGVERANRIPSGSVRSFEKDIALCDLEERYDIVVSLGFIGRSQDTRLILRKHVELLQEEGYLFVVLPNYLGLNGMLQRLFDPRDFARHNLKAMDPRFLKDVCLELGLKGLRVFYHGGMALWLSRDVEPGFLARLILGALRRTGLMVSRLLKLRSNLFFFSRIVITGTR